MSLLRRHLMMNTTAQPVTGEVVLDIDFDTANPVDAVSGLSVEWNSSAHCEYLSSENGWKLDLGTNQESNFWAGRLDFNNSSSTKLFGAFVRGKKYKIEQRIKVINYRETGKSTNNYFDVGGMGQEAQGFPAWGCSAIRYQTDSSSFFQVPPGVWIDRTIETDGYSSTVTTIGEGLSSVQTFTNSQEFQLSYAKHINTSGFYTRWSSKIFTIGGRQYVSNTAKAVISKLKITYYDYDDTWPLFDLDFTGSAVSSSYTDIVSGSLATIQSGVGSEDSTYGNSLKKIAGAGSYQVDGAAMIQASALSPFRTFIQNYVSGNYTYYIEADFVYTQPANIDMLLFGFSGTQRAIGSNATSTSSFISGNTYTVKRWIDFDTNLIYTHYYDSAGTCILEDTVTLQNDWFEIWKNEGIYNNIIAILYNQYSRYISNEYYIKTLKCYYKNR